MGWLSGLLGGNVSETVTAVADGLDGLFTSDDERLTHKEVMERLEQQPAQAQMAVNAVEARHRSIFVAGWRPFVGWVCGMALAYQYLIHPILSWIVTLTVDAPIYPPEIDLATMMPVLLGMLGLGALRTVEKTKKVAK
jgi:Holin of 3TMs, for gene-transfer release